MTTRSRARRAQPSLYYGLLRAFDYLGLPATAFDAFAQIGELRRFLAHPDLPERLWWSAWFDLSDIGVYERAARRASLLRHRLDGRRLALVRASLDKPGVLGADHVDALLRSTTVLDDALWRQILDMNVWRKNGRGVPEAVVATPSTPEWVRWEMAAKMSTLNRLRFAADHPDDGAEVAAAAVVRRAGPGVTDTAALLAIFRPDVAGRFAELLVADSAAAGSLPEVKVWLLAALRVWDTAPQLTGTLADLARIAPPYLPGERYPRSWPLDDPTMPAELAAEFVAAHGSDRYAEVRGTAGVEEAAFERVLTGTASGPLWALAASHRGVDAAVRAHVRGVVVAQDPLVEFRRLAAGAPFGLVSGGRALYDTPGTRTAPSAETLGDAERIIAVCGDDPLRWSLMWELLTGEIDVDVEVVADLVELSSPG